MSMKKLFTWISKITTQKPKMILGVSLIVTILMGYFTTFLELELSWVGLAPKGDPSVGEYQKIIDDFPSMSSILIMVSSEDKDELERGVALAEERLSQLDKYISSVTAKVDEDFLINNGLLLSDESMIEAMTLYMSNPNMTAFLNNINYAMELQFSPSMKEELLNEEDYITSNLIGMDYFLHTLNEFLVEENDDEKFESSISRLVLGDPYIRSIDGEKVLITVQPKFDVMDYEILVTGVNTILKELSSLEDELNGVKYEMTGMHVVGKDEMESVESDSYITMVIGVVFILCLLYFAFRLFSAPLLAFVPLVVGVIWDIGLTSIIIGRLNLLTAFTAIMLIGLGIDFSVHILSGFTEIRSKETSATEAIKHTLINIGPSIFTGGLTTAAAFLTLTISSLEVLSELGIVMGMGIITTLIAVFFILPSILVLLKGKEDKMNSLKGEYRFIGKVASFSHRNRIIIGLLIIVLVITMAWQGRYNQFDLNMMNLEPKGLKSIELMKVLEEEFGMSSEGLLVEKNSMDEIYELSQELKKEESVASVMSIVDFIPKEEEQKRRLEKIKDLNEYFKYQPQYEDINRKKLIIEVQRLKRNVERILSISEKAGAEKIKFAAENLLGESEASSLEGLVNALNNEDLSTISLNKASLIFYNTMSKISKDMIPEDVVTVSDLPNNYKKQLVSEDGSGYLLTVYPSFEIWENLDKDKGQDFLEMLRSKDSGFTGSPIFMKVLYESAKDEVVKAGILVIVTLLIILLLHFKSLKFTLLAFLPLLFTIFITLGAVKLVGLKWNILNVLAFPLIIGIGIDDAVHVLHRYKTTKDSITKVFSSVGRAILITTLTTMAGFGSLVFSSYRGMAYLGAVLTIGVAVALLMTVLILPIFLKERKA